jgi:hypothetical protein
VEPLLTAVYQTNVQVEVAGSQRGLSLLAEALASNQRKAMELAQPAQVEAWDGWLSRIEILPASGKVLVSRVDRILKIEGDPGGLTVLGDNVRKLAAGGLGSHIHEEYYSGHPFLDPDTMPLILALAEEQS